MPKLTPPTVAVHQSFLTAGGELQDEYDGKLRYWLATGRR